ncbi:arsenate reductase [Pedobacter sp. MC2016-14]|uniref:arsenate reductase n=1 Tax=Pedobacter sp. MC2016-14 TaxID=2897327 RepID=UPI001E580FCC|nr:arsenate reductase [Pedobacter sp. MC2016-14]MCD0487984.1 arsenate reductase [Pedobacter sp. MC2016-14]
MILYGIPNCNTVKKAQTWLKEKGLQYEFHDFKKKGISEEKLREWCLAFGWEKVLNKNGTTWKKLSDEEKGSVADEGSAIAVLLKNTSAIKRPVLEQEGKAVLIGFDEAAYAAKFS